MTESEEKIKLIVKKDGNVIKTYNVPDNAQIVTVGRAGDADVSIPDETSISRTQIEIRKKESSFFAVDVSRNGSKINGEKMISKKETELRNGDIISFEGHEVLFHNPLLDMDQTTFKSEDMTAFVDLSDKTELHVEKIVRLSITSDNQLISTIEMEDNSTLEVGKAPDIDIVLPGDQTISKKHCTIRTNNKLVTVNDKSLNGVTVNLQRIKKGEDVLLKHGDILGVGEFQVQIEMMDMIITKPGLAQPSGARVPAPRQPGTVPPSARSIMPPVSLHSDSKSRNFKTAAGVIVLLAGSLFMWKFFGSNSGNRNMEGMLKDVGIFNAQDPQYVEPMYDVEVIAKNFSEKLELPGIINFLDPKPVVSEIGGKITRVGFKEGQVVQEGQVLFEIENVSVEIQIMQAKADLISAKENLNRFKKIKNTPEYVQVKFEVTQAKEALNRLKRWDSSPAILAASRALQNSENTLDAMAQRKESSERLFKKGIISKDEIERIRLQYDTAVNQHKNQQSQFDLHMESIKPKLQAAETNLKKARLNFNNVANRLKERKKVADIGVLKGKKILSQLEKKRSSRNIMAAVKGIITFPSNQYGKQEIVVGQNLNPDSVIAFIGDLNDLGMKVEVPESEINRVKVGMNVIVTAESVRDMDIFGMVREIASAATIKDNSSFFDIKIGIKMNKPLKEKLRQGASANAQVIISDRENAVAVPVEAVFDYEGNPSVFRVDSVHVNNFENLPSIVPVKSLLGDRESLMVEAGLSVGDFVRVVPSLEQQESLIEKIKNNMKNESIVQEPFTETPPGVEMPPEEPPLEEPPV